MILRVTLAELTGLQVKDGDAPVSYPALGRELSR